MPETPLTIITRSADETNDLGEILGRLIERGDLVCLSGELGAGKTTFTRGLARGWGARENATSPTFTLINEYTRARDDQRFYHMDGYRLSGAAEAQTTALEDVLDAPGVVVIEWPERIRDILPDERLWIDIVRSGPGERTFTLNAGGPRAEALIGRLTAHRTPE